jgi:hypothetical protein
MDDIVTLEEGEKFRLHKNWDAQFAGAMALAA